MSDENTTILLNEFRDQAPASRFLASTFQSPPRNFHRTEKVEIDVRRSTNKIAIPVPDVTAGTRLHQSTLYVNKGYTPTVIDMETTISSYNKMKRQSGASPLENPDYMREALTEAFLNMNEVVDMIRRTIELMASQVYQTGAISLVDATGTVIYDVDFEAKATHLEEVSTAWAADGTSGDPLADLEALAVVVRRDGNMQPNQLLFGASAMNKFLANPKVNNQLDSRRMLTATIQPQKRMDGATFRGTIWIGHYEFEMWMYDGYYEDPVTSLLTPYINDEHVIMRSSGARMDLTFGEIPMFLPPDAVAEQFLPANMNIPEIGLGLTTNAWVTPDRKHLKLSVGTRPLTIPTAIDTFARLKVTVG
jgi:hypothetical protein